MGLSLAWMLPVPPRFSIWEPDSLYTLPSASESPLECLWGKDSCSYFGGEQRGPQAGVGKKSPPLGLPTMCGGTTGAQLCAPDHRKQMTKHMHSCSFKCFLVTQSACSQASCAGQGALNVCIQNDASPHIFGSF